MAVVACCLAALTAAPVRATTYDDGQRHTIDGFDFFVSVNDGPDGAVTILDVVDGGEISNALRTYDSSEAHVTGGFVGWIDVNDTSLVTVAAGTVGEVNAYAGGVAYLAGGQVERLNTGIAGGTIKVFGENLSIVDDTLTGTLRDGTPIDADVAMPGSGEIQLNPPPDRWQNPLNPLDTSNDGLVAPIDALLVINELNKNNSHALPPKPLDPSTGMIDVDGDNIVAPLDALLVINFLNQQAAAATLVGEGAPVSVPEPSTLLLGVAGLLILLVASRRH